ncbi:hypothetical protein ACFFR3_39185 [Nonomuraea salmonea]|jgi:hypothetical protein|uniref:DUF5666 domain-containing protein n=2 Tax=Nonomuraea salmonea TaxID=46181 RepID=A0ABV5NZ01_9ACTN
MLTRRLAIVVTAAALGLGGMATSALADDGPVRVIGERVMDGDRILRGGKLTCWTRDGRKVRFSDRAVDELVEVGDVGPVRVVEPVPAGGDGEVVVVPEERLSIAVPARKLPRKVVGKRWRQTRLIHLTCVWEGMPRR